MAIEYIHELGDSLSTGASSDGPHVKVIAPEKYKESGSDTYKTISVEINSKYVKPSGGIPKSDLASAVRASLGKADTALQSEHDPVFSASAAAGISSSDITDWNSKQPGRLVVSSDDNTAFSKISAAIAAGKDVWLNTNATYSGATYSHYVPLTEAVFRSGSYTAFIFARSRSYSDENGIVDRWTCTSSSWTYETEAVAFAVTAGAASTAGTANSASNANLGKTTDATNGDLLYIGGGTQQRVTNAAHANSAKDYDQTGSIATALASKQPTVVFYGTSIGGTLSDPAISKTMYYAARPSHVIAYARNFADTYDDLTGHLLSTVEIDKLRCLDELFLVATNRDSVSVGKGVSQQIIAFGPLYTGGDTPAQIVGYTLKPNMPYNGPNGNKVPVNEHGWRQHVVFELSLINTSPYAEKIYLESGGAYRSGTGGYAGQYTESIIYIDGALYGTPGNPSSWSDNYRYRVAIGSVPARGSRTWHIEWWKTRYTESSATYYETEYVMVTTIK